MSKWITYYRSPDGYGSSLSFGKRLRINSPGALTPMRPHFYKGGDEDCNSSISLHLWPLFGIDFWYEHPWRPPGTGTCDVCKAEFEEAIKGPNDD